MRKFTLARVAAFFLVLQCTAHADAQNADTPSSRFRTIQVIGTGSVQVKPDTASITVGVVTEDESAQRAIAQNNSQTAKVLAALEAVPIEKRDIKTSNFSVFPQYRTQTSKSQASTYRVTNQIIANIHDLDRLGDVLSKVAAAGSNQIAGPGYFVSEPERYLNEARQKAVQNAMAKANIYASAAGAKAAQILEIAEQGGSAPVYSTRSAAFSRSAAPVPVEAGEETLRAEVLMIFKLDQ